MKTVKIHTTPSTNDLLKEMLRQNDLENYTTVWAKHQTAGRGQRGNTWQTESGKNLTFSILIALKDFEIQRQFELNQAISLAVIDVLKPILQIVHIKWPNDILSDKKKIGGILIENNIQGNFIKNSVIGIGLNVNQTSFHQSLTSATSLKNILGHEVHLDLLLGEIQIAIQKRIEFMQSDRLHSLIMEYTENLFGWQKWNHFSSPEGLQFDGKIIGISAHGKLEIEMKNGVKELFGLQEIRFEY